MKVFFLIQLSLTLVAMALSARAARLKDVSNIRGVRDNQLIGYGLVVGLKGTGDGKSEYTSKSIYRMLDRLGMKLDQKEVSSQNIASVLVTAKLPPFARSGNKIDITVNSIGDASSLKGGTLIQTPLRASDQQIYAVAQGGLVIGGDNSHETSGRISNGAIIEKDFTSDFANRKMYRLTLHNPDFTTAARVAKTVNQELGGKYATAKDASTIDVITPFSYEGRGVELLATIELIQVSPDIRAKVIVNEKTGTVVIGQKVRVTKVAISHGDLSIKIAGAGGGKGKQSEKRVAFIDGSVSVGSLVNSLNRLGVTPKDLITILQSIQAAGALHGDLEIL